MHLVQSDHVYLLRTLMNENKVKGQPFFKVEHTIMDKLILDN